MSFTRKVSKAFNKFVSRFIKGLRRNNGDTSSMGFDEERQYPPPDTNLEKFPPKPVTMTFKIPVTKSRPRTRFYNRSSASLSKNTPRLGISCMTCYNCKCSCFLSCMACKNCGCSFLRQKTDKPKKRLFSRSGAKSAQYRS